MSHEQDVSSSSRADYTTGGGRESSSSRHDRRRSSRSRSPDRSSSRRHSDRYDDKYSSSSSSSRYDDRYHGSSGRSSHYSSSSHHSSSAPLSKRLYIWGTGNASTADIERTFGKYGHISDISIKQNFCFVEFQDERDAAEAVYARDGYDFNGTRLRVEHCRPRPRDAYFAALNSGDRGSFRGEGAPPKCFNCSELGHIARDCKNGNWKNRCYVCKEEGHRSMDCPTRSGSRGAPPSAAGDAPSSSARRSRSRDRSPRRSSRSRSRGRDEHGSNGQSAPPPPPQQASEQPPQHSKPAQKQE